MKPLDEFLRVLVVSDAYPPLIGGANRSTQLTAHALARVGHHVTVATAHQPGQPQQEFDGLVEVYRVRDLTSRVSWLSADPYVHVPPPFPDPEATVRLRSLIRRLQPDVVYAYGWLAHSTAAALIGTNIPLILVARDYGNFCAVRTYVHEGKTCEGPAPVKCFSCAAEFYGRAKGTVAVAGVAAGRAVVRRRVSGVHAVSRFMGRQIGDYVTAGLDVDTEVILNFRNPSGNAACYEPILADLPTEPFILYVGAFRRVKGIHVLLDSYSALRRPRPPLVLMGTRAPDTPARFPDGVHVLYDVPHHAVMWAWTRAMFGVFPSIWAEPLGNVVHEAMRQGRPVIGTRPGGHEDLIVDGLNGLLVAAGSVEELTTAMQHLADSSPLRERMGQAARIKADELHVDRVMPRIEALLLRTQEERR